MGRPQRPSARETMQNAPAFPANATTAWEHLLLFIPTLCTNQLLKHPRIRRLSNHCNHCLVPKTGKKGVSHDLSATPAAVVRVDVAVYMLRRMIVILLTPNVLAID